MSNSIIKKHLTTDEEIQLPTYKKLPPIQQTQKMQGRKLLSTNSVLVDFNPPSVGQSNPFSANKNPVRKTSADSLKSEAVKSTANQNAALSRQRPIVSGGKSIFRMSGNADQLSNGIELVGFKMTNDRPASGDENKTLPQQASGWTPLSTELPPCRICGDKASGLHYGVNTCEACKAFFRRTLKKSAVDFQCTCTPEERDLGTDNPRKTTCPKCRYERCMKVGMSKDAIKIGRYTISRKRQNDREVKTLKQSDRISGVRRISENSKSNSSSSPYSTSQSISSPEELSSDITSLSLKEKVTQKAKKRRQDGENAPEAGLLYRSLTNSIFMSLLDQHDDSTTAILPEQTTELSPVEKLLRTDWNKPASQIEQVLSSNRDADLIISNLQSGEKLSAVENLLNSNGSITEEMSPRMQLLSTNQQTPPKSSPIEELFRRPFNSSSETRVSLVTDTSSRGQYQFQTNQSQNPSSEIHFHSEEGADKSTAVMRNNKSQTGNNVALPVLSKAVSYTQISATQSQGESPIESLLMSPSAPLRHSTIVNVSYTSNINTGNVESNLNMSQAYPITAPLEHTMHYANEQNHEIFNPEIEFISTDQSFDDFSASGPLEMPLEDFGESAHIESELENSPQEIVLVAGCEGCTFSKEDIEKDGLYENNFVESLEETEIQALQLYRFENPVLVVGSGISLEEVVDIMMMLGKAAEVLFNKTKISCSEIKKRHADYLEQYTLKMQVFGNMNISKEEYLQFYNQTGIDIDNRQQILIEALKYLEESIAKLVKFAKAIPGFSDIDIDDQVSLVKASRFEHDMIQFNGQVSKCIQSSLKIATLPWDKEYHFDEISKIFPKHFCSEKMGYLQQVIQLGLSFEETVLLKSLVITFPDRCVLKQPEKVERVHNRLIACFLYVLSNRPADKLVAVQTILETLFKQRQLAIWDTQIIQEMFEVWPVTSNHQLVKEFVS